MKKIAIVDDNPNFRNFYKEHLLESGKAEVVLTSGSGKEFIDTISPSPERYAHIDLVLMDIEMPEMDGIATLKKLKELLPSTEVIMLTVFDENDKVFDAIKFGAIGYLLKDEPVEKIIETIVSVAEEDGAVMSPRIARKVFNLLQNKREDPSKSSKGEEQLSVREEEILKMMVEGLNYQEIAVKLFISPQTVRTHLKNIYRKLHVRNKVEAVTMAMKKRWF